MCIYNGCQNLIIEKAETIEDESLIFTDDYTDMPPLSDGDEYFDIPELIADVDNNLDRPELADEHTETKEPEVAERAVSTYHTELNEIISLLEEILSNLSCE